MTPLTEPGATIWGATPAAYRRHESTSWVGRGDEAWSRACAALLRWEVKTRSGFEVRDAHEVVVDERLELLVRVGPSTIREPIEVVEVVRTEDRVGFAYRTLPGHPVQGEETFVLTRTGDEVRLVLRSLTRPSTTWRWAAVHPALRLAQAVVRRRYHRALRD